MKARGKWVPPWAILRRDGRPRLRMTMGAGRLRWRSCDGTPSAVDDSTCPNCNDCSLNNSAQPGRRVNVGKRWGGF